MRAPQRNSWQQTESSFILYPFKRTSPSTRHHLTGPSCQQLGGALMWVGESWSALVSRKKSHLSSALACTATQCLILPDTCFFRQLRTAWERLEATAACVRGGRWCWKSNHKPSCQHSVWLRKSLSCEFLLQDKEKFSAQISLCFFFEVILLCQYPSFGPSDGVLG